MPQDSDAAAASRASVRSRVAALLTLGLLVALVGGGFLALRLRDVEARRVEAAGQLASAAEALRTAEAGRVDLAASLASQSALAAREGANRAAVEAGSAALLAEGRAALLPLGHLAALERAARVCLESYAGRADASLPATSQALRASALDLLGEVLLRRDRTEEAEEAFRAGVALAVLRAENEPDVPARAGAAAEAHLRLARALDRRGAFTEALDVQQEALRILRALNDKDPRTLAWLGALAATLTETGATFTELKQGAEARAHVEEAVALGKALCQRAPEDTRWVRQLAEAHQVLGDVNAVLGTPAAAEQAYRAALSHLATLAPRDANVIQPDVQTDQADLLLKLGTVSTRSGRISEAVGVLREALCLCVTLAGAEPARVDAQERLARVCDALSGALEADGQDEDALAGRREAAWAWKRVAGLEGPGSPRRIETLRAALRLGDALARAGMREEALEAYREAAGLAAVLGVDAGTPAVHGSDLAESWDRIALTLVSLGRRTEALEAWRGALAAIEPLAKKTPENAFWQADLARIWWHLGTVLSADEAARDEGLRALKRAQRLLAALDENRRTPDYAQGWSDAVADALRGSTEPEPAR